MAKKEWLILGTILLGALLTGCQTAENDADIQNAVSELEQITGEYIASDASELLLSKQEKWTETIPVTNGYVKRVQISAEPKLPATDHMSVLKLQPMHKTREMMEKIASVFDNGRIYIFDEAHPPKWYLDIQINENQEALDAIIAQRGDAASGVNEEGELWSLEDTGIPKQLREYKAAYDSAPEEGEIPTDYTENSYYGTMNGIYYDVEILLDTEYGIVLTITPFTYSKLVCYDGSEDLKGVVSTLEYSNGENYADIQEVSAKERAEELLANLGFQDFRTVDSQAAVWGRTVNGNEQELFCEGYMVKLTRNVAGVSIPPRRYNYALGYRYRADGVVDYSYNIKNADEYARVTVTDQGYADIYICQPCEVEETLAKATPLMNFSQLKEVMSEQIAKHPRVCGYSQNEFVYFDTMELRYFTVIDSEGGKVILPVWELNSPYEEQEPTNAFIVNAIDGSFIDVFDERYTVDDSSDDDMSDEDANAEDTDLPDGGA